MTACSLFTLHFSKLLWCSMLLVVLGTLDLEREEEKENLRRMLRSHAQVIRVISYLLVEGTLFFSEVNTLFQV